jgi:hypothetical protein
MTNDLRHSDPRDGFMQTGVITRSFIRKAASHHLSQALEMPRTKRPAHRRADCRSSGDRPAVWASPSRSLRSIPKARPSEPLSSTLDQHFRSHRPLYLLDYFWRFVTLGCRGSDPTRNCVYAALRSCICRRNIVASDPNGGRAGGASCIRRKALASG